MDENERIDAHPGPLVMFVISALALAVLTVGGCRLPPPGTPPQGPIACTVDAIQRCWPSVIGPVNTCLTGTSATSCLLGLIQPSGCAVESVIACLVRQQGAEFAHSARMNPDDVRSARAAENARNFLADRGYTFVEVKP